MKCLFKEKWIVSTLLIYKGFFRVDTLNNYEATIDFYFFSDEFQTVSNVSFELDIFIF